MTPRVTTYYHGGVAGLNPGDALRPAPPHVDDGCPICVARREGRGYTMGEYRAWARARGAAQVLEMLAGEPDWIVIDPPSARQALYMTTDLDYARFYAARSGHGDLYEVEPHGQITPSDEDPFPSWTAPGGFVTRVVERKVRLTDRDRQRLWDRWGEVDKARGLRT